MQGLRSSALAVAGVFVTACTASSPLSSKSAQTEPVSNHAPAPPAETLSIIDLRPLTITFGGQPIARLLDDGRMESVGPNPPGVGPFVPGPTLRRDGTIVLTKAGFTARVERSGDIFVVNPAGQSAREQRFGRIEANRLRFASGAEGVRIDEATIVFDHPGPPEVIGTIEGIVDDGTRHTALVMTAAVYIDMAITAR